MSNDARQITNEEERALFARAGEHIPPAPPAAQPTRTLGMVRVRQSPQDAEDVASLVDDAAHMLLTYLSDPVARTHDEPLRFLLLACRRNLEGVRDLIRAYDDEVKP